MQYKDTPIIILACPRSGSSMTAGLFAKHGVWYGTSREADSKNPKGYFENTHLKNLLKNTCGTGLLRLSYNIPREQAGFKSKVIKLLTDDGYQNGKYFFKHSALYWKVWHEFNPRFICVRRNFESTLNSNYDFFNRAMSHEDLITIIKAHEREMSYIEKHYGAATIYTDQIIEGEYGSLQNAMAYCGIKMDFKIVDEFVEPKYWKH